MHVQKRIQSTTDASMQASAYCKAKVNGMAKANGMALILVLIAVATAVILGSTFLASQSTNLGVAQNIKRHAQARSIAESALTLAIEHLKTSTTFRTDFAEGNWITDFSYANGSFTIQGYDGYDENGDGLIESDGDLNDDASDPVTLVAIGQFDGVTHEVRAVVTPGGTLGNRVLLIVPNPNSMNSREQERVTVMESMGFDVLPFDVDENQDEYDLATANVDAVYISESINSGNLGTKLRDNPIGVVSEEGYLADDFKFSNRNEYGSNFSDGLVLNNIHPVTSGLSLGAIEVLTQSHRGREYRGSLAVESETLMTSTSGRPILVVGEAGIALRDGYTAAGRRVFLPWGDQNFRFEWLTEDGLTLLENALNWAIGTSGAASIEPIVRYEFIETSVTPTLLAHWQLNETPSGGGQSAVYISDRITMYNKAFIDAYDSSAGPYHSSNNRSQNAVIMTNTTSNNSVRMFSDNKIYGNLSVGAGADPNNVLQTYNSAEVTGSVDAQTENFTYPSISLPSNLPPDDGNYTLNGGNVTLDTDRRYNRVTFNNNARMTVSGHRIMVIENQLTMNSGRIIVPEGSSLTIYIDQKMTLNNESTINDDSEGTDRLTIYFYGNDSNDDLQMNGDNVISGKIIGGDSLTMNNKAKIYGNILFRNDLVMNGDNSIHLDNNLSGAGSGTGSGGSGGSMGPAIEEIGEINGTYFGDATGGGSGPLGTAVSFDGSGDYIRIPHDEIFERPVGTFTFWVRTPNANQNMGLLGKDASGRSEGQFTAKLRFGRVDFELETASNSYSIRSSTSLRNNTWEHVALSWGPQGLKVFVNGVEEDSDAFTGGIESNTQPLALGGNTSNSGDGTATPLFDYFTGDIDDLRFYDVALDENQLADVMADATIRDGLGPIADVSDNGEPMDLTIKHPDRVRFIDGGGLEILNTTALLTTGPATKLYDALTASDEMTIIVEFETRSSGSLENILAVAGGRNDHNFKFSFNDRVANWRVRTTDTSSDNVELFREIERDIRYTVRMTYQEGEAQVYVNDVLADEKVITGLFDTWDASYIFSLLSDEDFVRPWRDGSIYSFEIYDRVLTTSEPSGGNGSGGTFAAQWIELDE